MEVSTILPSRDIPTSLPRYDSDQVANVIQNDISRLLQIHCPNTFITKTNSITHFIDNKLHSSNYIDNSSPNSTNSLLVSNQPYTPTISQGPSSIILRQIINNKIGFDFLTNAELMSFLNTIVSIIDKSYQASDLSELLNLFSQLIIAQSVHVLRSCPIRQEHISITHPCLIVSTLFLRPSVKNDIPFSVYRLIALPAIIDDEQYIYSNLPVVIGVNTEDQSIILWNNAPKKNECLFSIFVYCQKKPPSIELHNSPCLSELFNYSTPVASSCQITRSRQVQTDVINVDNDVWLFSHNGDPLDCQLQSNMGDINGIITITEPSIVRVPCGNIVKCNNAEFSSSTCTNRSILIKSAVTQTYESLSTVPWSIKKMTKQLESAYKNTFKNSLEDTLGNLKDNRLTVLSCN